jgi:hypothetical protein
VPGCPIFGRASLPSVTPRLHAQWRYVIQSDDCRINTVASPTCYEADMIISGNLTPGPSNIALFLSTRNQLLNVTRYCRTHAIPIMDESPDLQISVFADSVDDLRNLITCLLTSEPPDHPALPSSKAAFCSRRRRSANMSARSETSRRRTWRTLAPAS